MAKSIGNRGEHGFGLHGAAGGARVPAGAGGPDGGARAFSLRPVLWLAGAAATLKYLADTWPF